MHVGQHVQFVPNGHELHPGYTCLPAVIENVNGSMADLIVFKGGEQLHRKGITFIDAIADKKGAVKDRIPYFQLVPVDAPEEKKIAVKKEDKKAETVVKD